MTHPAQYLRAYEHVINHDHYCNCRDCSAMNEAAATLMLQRDPRQILDRARQHTDDKFAFGILQRAEQELTGVKVYSPDLLPQSQPVVISDPFAWRHS